MAAAARHHVKCVVVLIMRFKSNKGKKVKKKNLKKLMNNLIDNLPKRPKKYEYNLVFFSKMYLFLRCSFFFPKQRKKPAFLFSSLILIMRQIKVR